MAILNIDSAETLLDDWVEVQEMPVRAKPVGKEEQKTDQLDVRLYARMNEVVNQHLIQHSSPIFATDVDSRQLYTSFLDALPQHMRQLYNCNTCRAFVRRYGGLALVDDATGELQPLLWNIINEQLDAPFRLAILAVAQQFKKGKAVTEFKITMKLKSRMEATAEKGGFNHMFLSIPSSRVSKEASAECAPTSTTYLAKMLAEVLRKYRPETIKRTAQIVEQDKVPHAENHKAAMRWLLDLLESDKLKKNDSDKISSRCRQNLGYLCVASAFVGCISQLKNGVLSTLLDAVEADQPWDMIERAWRQKTDPIQYLRPQVSPKSGNIAASERLFSKLQITEHDMNRRYLVFDDIPKEVIMWHLQETASKVSTGLFANITPKQNRVSLESDRKDLPPTRITFTKFVTTILPTAKKVEYRLSLRDGLYFMVTGHPGTKPLMQWHHEDNTNRASWYIYQQPFPVKDHNLKPGAWNEVKAVIPFPHLWDGLPATTKFPLQDENSTDFKFYHKKQGFRYLLAFKDIVDKNTKGLNLFPTMLKGDFHGARATIEAYSNKGHKEMVEDVEQKGGYVGGIGVGRSMGKSAGAEEGKHLIRVTDGKDQVGVWEVALFE